MASALPSIAPLHTDDFQSGYFSLVERLLSAPVLLNAPRGKRSRELVCVDLVLSDPRNRLIAHPARRANLAFQFGELLWYLSGSNELPMLEYYAPSVRSYSADGQTLSGTAYGPRIFGSAGAGQWAAVRDLLRQDPDTKRAVISIFDASELLDGRNPDVACTLALHFMCRERKLHCFVIMRANDAYRGIVSDVFSFTMLHELMAVELDLQLGVYFHRVDSLHLYETDLVRAEGASRGWRENGRSAAQPMPPMPGVPMKSWLPAVLAMEAEMRLAGHGIAASQIEGSGLPEYWRQVVAVLSQFSDLKAGRPVRPDILPLIPESWQAMIDARFSTRSADAIEASRGTADAF